MDDAVLKMHGIIEKDSEEESKFKTVDCPRCKTINPPGSSFCSSCSLGLDLNALRSFEKTRDDFNANFLNLIKDKELALQTLEALTRLIQNQ
jgi:hypothetical protein